MKIEIISKNKLQSAMKINQLFRVKVTNELFLKIYQCFGYTVLNSEYMFCKGDLEKLNTLQHMSILREELCQYYIPCKQKIYLTSLNLNKCITVFRQVLKLYNIILMSRQKYIKHKKTTFYSLKFENEHEDIHAMRVVSNSQLVVTFT